MPASPHGHWLGLLPLSLLSASSLTRISGDGTSNCDLRRVDGRAVTVAQFDSVLRRQAPILLTGLTDGWAAADPVSGWVNATAFAERYGTFDLPLRAADDLANRGSAYAAQRVRVDQYQNFTTTRGPSSTDDEALFSNTQEPLSVALQGDYNWPNFLDGVTYDHIVGVGHPGTGVPFHRHVENWIATFGRKHWFLLPPHEPNPPVMSPCGYRKTDLAPTTLECEQDSGEVLFIPSGWWHATCNLDWVVGIGGQGLDGLSGPLPRIHRAALSGDLESMQAMTDKQRDYDAKSAASTWHNGLQPLHLAAKNGHAHIVRWLIADQDVPVNEAQDTQLWTPLHWAAQRGHFQVTKLLLESGADISARDSLGFVAVQYACYTGRLNILELLLQVGATTRPRDSQACEDLARRQGYVHVAEWVLQYERTKAKKGRKRNHQRKRKQRSDL